MLKRFGVFVVGTLYLMGLVALPPNAQALEATAVIYQLQAGITGGATQEYVSFANTSSVAVDVTGWCLTKTSGTDTGTPSVLGCVMSPDLQMAMWLPAGGAVTFATAEFVAAHSGFAPDVIFSADLASTGGHVRLVDANKREVDRLGWGNAVHPETLAAAVPSNPKILQRVSVDGVLQDIGNNSVDFAPIILEVLPSRVLYEQEIPVDVCLNIPDFQVSMPDGYMYDGANDCRQDVCQNLPLLQLDVPDGYYESTEFVCELSPLENAPLAITELLPNTTSYDTGNEFIELYNPTTRFVSLDGYVLQVGPSFSKSYALPVEQIIGPAAYLSFSDLQTGLVLANTNAQLRLVAPDGTVVSTTEPYESPVEDYAWALIGNSWQYTNQPTPAAANLESTPTAQDDEEVNTLPACPTGQYRNPETNRCRMLQAVVSVSTPCKAGQVRNAETNRCRSVLSAAAGLIPCQPGQERNPETNRCRMASGNVLGACAEGQERNPETNRCRKKASTAGSTTAKVQDVFTPSSASSMRWWIVGVAILLAAGYMLYEWRQDIANILHKYRAKKFLK